MRDYGTGKWEGGDPQCDHSMKLGGDGAASEKQVTSEGTQQYRYRDVCGKCGARRIDQQIGLEATPDEYIAKLVAVFREVRRVLRDDGTCFVNMGDSYAGYWGEKYAHRPFGEDRTADESTPPNKSSLDFKTSAIKPKDMMLMPFRLAIALQADGWFIRDIIVWHKPNPMPSSVQDRCTSSWEPIIMMAKSGRYFADMLAVSETVNPESVVRASYGFGVLERDGEVVGNIEIVGNGPASSRIRKGLRGDDYVPENRNLRNVWQLSTQGTPDAHFATFPEELPSRCIKIGTSEFGACPQCGAPWERIVERNRVATRPGEESKVYVPDPEKKQDALGDPRMVGFNERWRDSKEIGNRDPQRHVTQTKTIGARATCQCNAEGDPVPCVVLDPFLGSGTTSKCARILGRHSLGCELSEKYARDIACAKIADAFEEKRRPKAKQAVGQKSIFDE